MQEMQKAWVRSLGQGDSLEKGMATHSSILPCKIPWTKEPHIRDSLVIQWVKDPPAMQETQETCRFDPWVKEDPLEEGMVTYSSILAWKIPWTEEPAGLQSKGSQRIRHNWETKHIYAHYYQICYSDLWSVIFNITIAERLHLTRLRWWLASLTNKILLN